MFTWLTSGQLTPHVLCNQRLTTNNVSSANSISGGDPVGLTKQPVSPLEKVIDEINRNLTFATTRKMCSFSHIKEQVCGVFFIAIYSLSYSVLATWKHLK